MKAEKKTMACYGLVLLACALFLLWMLTGRYYPEAPLDFGSTDPLTVEAQGEGKERLYSAVLPPAFSNSQSLLFKTTHAMVEVLVDGTTVYTYGWGDRVAGKSPGSYWHVVSIPAGSQGRALTIRLTSAYDTLHGLDMHVQYGSRGDCILAFENSFLPLLIMNCIIITIGLISLFLCAVAVVRREKQERTGFLCIGLFSLTISLWSLRQCGFLQFLIPSGEVMYYLDLHLLFLVLPPLDVFMHSICRTKWRQGFLWIAAAFLLGVIVTTAMQLAGIVDIFELLPGLHMLIAFNGAYMFWVIHRESAEHRGGRVDGMRVPLYTLIVFGVLELVTYYVPIFGELSVFLPLGAMVFILMLIWQQVEGHYQNILEEQKLLYYEKLANTDLLTGAYSRNAYENMLKSLDRAENKQSAYGAVLFDLNDMKLINDSCGHEKGDEAIRFCHDLILEAFGDKGKCYRIGGDEFVFLAFDKMDFAGCAARFDTLLAQYEERLTFPFSVALGYAAFDASKDSSFQETIKRSDAMMYLDKRKKKG